MLLTGASCSIAFASSWNIIGGYAGYISLGHNVFFAIGGYAAAILFAYFGVSPFITAAARRTDRAWRSASSSG